ncbi:MAG TPA: hypothetical protein VFA81_12190, partial [Burkholderiales bacterium]|nr:hypothetical protein [Burkholderiales bacterium]
VAVAWAEDGIDDHERRIVLARATELGLREADAGYRLLERWLAEPPPELLANWKRDYVGGLSLILTHEAKHELKSQILAGARRLAEANDALSGAGRALSDAEQAVLEEIEDAFS